MIQGIKEPNVERWLKENIEGVSAPFSYELIAGGHSNLTYGVTDSEGKKVVLRRPPLGHVLESAHDMAREHEIISALFGYGSFDEKAVFNSAKALYYFGLGLPAFALIKIFSTFFFANHDTKTPFYISLISVILNISISIYFFDNIGFIIIPIATTISSWFNSIILFIFLKKNNLFNFTNMFFIKFFKIVIASILMGIFFRYLIEFFDTKLVYDYELKSIYLVLSVLLGLIFYLILSFFIKAFNYKDLKLKY